MSRYKHSLLKNKSFDEIQKLFDKEMTRVNMFVDMDTEMKEGSNKAKTDTTQESSSKRAGDELEQEKVKKQKGDDDQEEEEMKKHIEIVQDDEGIDREDLETLWKLVKAKHGLRRLDANERPPMLEKGNYIPWESRFRRFLDNKLEDGDRMWNSIQNGPYQRPMVVDPTNPTERIKRLMHGSKITTHVRYSRLMDKFDKFATKEGESLDFVHERLTILVNIMDRNNVRPIPMAINTKFLNFLQPEWSKYVTMVRHNQTGSAVSYDVLYDSLVQFEPHVLASRAKKAAKNHDPLLLLLIQMLLHHTLMQTLLILYNHTMLHILHQSLIMMMNIKGSYGGNVNKNAGRNRTQGFNTGNAGHYARERQKPKVHDAKYFREQMLLAMKDEAGSNLSNEENDFMLDTSYGENLEELTTTVMLMARLQPTNDNAENVPFYDTKVVSQVHASSKIHEQVSRGKRETIIQTTNDDQIGYNIIFDDPFVENSGGTSEHDSTAHDEYREIKMLAYNVQHETENQKRFNNELKQQKDLLQWEFETFKDRLEKKAFKEREYRYLDDILDLEEKLSSHDRIVYKMGQSIQTIHMLEKKPNNVYDPFLKAGLGYTNPVRLKKAIATQPKMYDGDLIHNNKLVIHLTDSEETLEDVEEIRNKMRHKMVQIDYEKLNALYETFVPQHELFVEQTYFSIPSNSDNDSKSKDVPSESPEQQKHELLKVELEKSSSDSRDIQANLLKRIKILENDFQRSQAQSIAFELKLQHQKEKMACDVSWKAKLSTLHDENVLLKHQVESTVKERENIKLEFQRLFNSVKATRVQHQNEINEMVEKVSQKTYDYAKVRAQNQDLLMTISELKSKLRTIDKGKHVNTKFDKSKTLGQLLCVTPFNKNLAIKAKNVSNTKVTSDRPNPVTALSSLNS
ncbi:hypothetical protein Tco_1164143 [Tanacetum coccineum]